MKFVSSKQKDEILVSAYIRFIISFNCRSQSDRIENCASIRFVILAFWIMQLIRKIFLGFLQIGTNLRMCQTFQCLLKLKVSLFSQKVIQRVTWSTKRRNNLRKSFRSSNVCIIWILYRLSFRLSVLIANLQWRRLRISRNKVVETNCLFAEPIWLEIILKIYAATSWSGWIHWRSWNWSLFFLLFVTDSKVGRGKFEKKVVGLLKLLLQKTFTEWKSD